MLVWLPRVSQAVVAMLGVLRAGGAYWVLDPNGHGHLVRAERRHAGMVARRADKELGGHDPRHAAGADAAAAVEDRRRL